MCAQEERSQCLWRALERVIPDIRRRAELTLVATPLTHERFLRCVCTYEAAAGVGGPMVGRLGDRSAHSHIMRILELPSLHLPVVQALQRHLRSGHLGSQRKLPRPWHHPSWPLPLRGQLPAGHRGAGGGGQRHDCCKHSCAGAEPPAAAGRPGALIGLNTCIILLFD